LIHQSSLSLFKYYNTGHNEPVIFQRQILCSNYILTSKWFVKEYVSIRYCLIHNKEEKPLAFFKRYALGDDIKMGLKEME